MSKRMGAAALVAVMLAGGPALAEDRMVAGRAVAVLDDEWAVPRWWSMARCCTKTA